MSVEKLRSESGLGEEALGFKAAARGDLPSGIQRRSTLLGEGRPQDRHPGSRYRRGHPARPVQGYRKARAVVAPLRRRLVETAYAGASNRLPRFRQPHRLPADQVSLLMQESQPSFWRGGPFLGYGTTMMRTNQAAGSGRTRTPHDPAAQPPPNRFRRTPGSKCLPQNPP